MINIAYKNFINIKIFNTNFLKLQIELIYFLSFMINWLYLLDDCTVLSWLSPGYVQEKPHGLLLCII